jgi:uncharacterized protein (UPF0303 family)
VHLSSQATEGAYSLGVLHRQNIKERLSLIIVAVVSSAHMSLYYLVAMLAGSNNDQVKLQVVTRMVRGSFGCSESLVAI